MKSRSTCFMCCKINYVVVALRVNAKSLLTATAVTAFDTASVTALRALFNLLRRHSLTSLNTETSPNKITSFNYT